MKHLSYFLLGAAGLVLASCSNEELVNGGAAGDTANVTVNLELPQLQTRGYSDGETANRLQYAVYDITNGGMNIIEKYVKTESDAETIKISQTVSFQLVNGHKYGFVFWASNVGSPYTANFTEEGATVTAKYDRVLANDEKLDAFYAYKELEIKGDVQENVKLYRPFAQINVGTSDYEIAGGLGYVPTESQITVDKVYSSFDLISGDVTGDATAVTYSYSEIGKAEKFPVDSYNYLAMAYVLTLPDQNNVDVTFKWKGEDGIENERKVGSAPIQRNHRTNIYGQILTNNTELIVEIVPGFVEEEDVNIPLSTKAFLDAVKKGGNILMTENINYNDSKLYRIHFNKDAYVDLNGKTVTGSNYNGGEADGTFVIGNNANVTITGNGVMETSGNYGTILLWNADGVLTIENGTFISHPDDGEMIYAGDYNKETGETFGGVTYIKGGTFKCGEPEWTLNCQDQAFLEGKAKFVVSGGRFWNYDPSNATTEPAPHSPISWVEEGYRVIKMQDEECGPNDYWYVVVPDEIDAVADTTDDILAALNSGKTHILLTASEYIITDDRKFYDEGNQTFHGFNPNVILEGNGAKFIGRLSPKFDGATIKDITFENNGEQCIFGSFYGNFVNCNFIGGVNTESKDNPSSFKNCKFIADPDHNKQMAFHIGIINEGNEITLDNCEIDGRCDFGLQGGSMVFNECTLSIRKDWGLYSGPGSVTFKNCTIVEGNKDMVVNHKEDSITVSWED